MVAEQGLRQAEELVQAGDLSGGEVIWNDLIRKFVDTPWATQASEAQTALKADPNYNQRKRLAREIAAYHKAAERLKAVPDAQASALGPQYYLKNKSSLGKMQNVAEDMVELKETAAVTIVSQAKSLGLPLNKKEEVAFNNYHKCMGIAVRLKPRAKEQASWQDKNFRKRNQRNLLQMKAYLDQMRPYVLSGHMPDLGKRIFGD
jgi:hypothetical protein